MLNSAVVKGPYVTVEGTLNSTVGSTFRIDFFANTECDPSGQGEGETFLGSRDGVTTDEEFKVKLRFEAGDYITATATDLYGNTSEFSECLVVFLKG